MEEYKNEIEFMNTHISKIISALSYSVENKMDSIVDDYIEEIKLTRNILKLLNENNKTDLENNNL